MQIPLELPADLARIDLVYREHSHRLFRSLLAYTGDRVIAEDAMAEAFAQALRRGPALRQPERWVWRAAFRIAAGWLKDRERYTVSGVEPSYELDEVSPVLREALATLPVGQRAAVILHYYADLSTSDVAAVLGSTGPAVRVALMRARRRLRTLLETPDG